MAQCNLLTLQLWSVHTDLSEKKIPDSCLLLMKMSMKMKFELIWTTAS